MIALRPATTDDALHVYRWNAAEDVRALSRDPRPIAMESHVTWFAARLRDATPMWVIERDGEPVGVVRVDERAGQHWISIALDPRARGQGLGRLAIEHACNAIGGEIHAEIRVANLASIRCFTACGFQLESASGDFAHFRWTRGDRHGHDGH